MADIQAPPGNIQAYLSTYKSYTARFTQSGTDAPIPSVIYSTFGVTEWGRNENKTYFMSTDMDYAPNVDNVYISFMGAGDSQTNPCVPLFVNPPFGGLKVFYTLYPYNEGGKLYFGLDVFDIDHVFYDFSEWGISTLHLPEIRVYQ